MPTPTVAPATAAAPTGAVKSPIRGLVSMGAYKFVGSWGEPDNELETVRKKPGLLSAIVILASWRDLERSATSGLTADNQIDHGLAEVRKYNAEHPKNPLTVKIRVWGGFWAPKWVWDESGGPIHLIHITGHEAEKKRTVGHVWSKPYRDRWAHLQEMLAAKYDSEPLIHEVAVTSCMMFTAEPFFVDTHDVAMKPLRDAGMTDANFKACLDGAIDDYKPWKTTRFEMPLNPFRLTDQFPKYAHDLQFTLDWMKKCAEREPERCVFDNHDLDTKGITKELTEVYDAMGKSKQEVEFQTGPAMPDDIDGTFTLAASHGATSVELYQDFKGFPELGNEKLTQLAKELEKNAHRIKD
jgi:hypothetical protein